MLHLKTNTRNIVEKTNIASPTTPLSFNWRVGCGTLQSFQGHNFLKFKHSALVTFTVAMGAQATVCEVKIMDKRIIVNSIIYALNHCNLTNNQFFSASVKKNLNWNMHLSKGEIKNARTL